MASTPHRANVYLHERLVGQLVRESGQRVTFTYHRPYVAQHGPALSLSLPVREEPFVAEGLPAYFSGLCSEGWLRQVQSFRQQIDPADEFTLLVLNGADLAGAVTIHRDD